MRSGLLLIGLVASLGLAGCMHSVKGGQMAFDRGDYDLAAKRWNLEAVHGHNGKANYGIGVIHENGLGSTPRNANVASHWYLRSAQAGYVPGMLALARLQMASGQETAAISWYQQAAQQGSGEAMQNLAARGIPVQSPQANVPQAGLDPIVGGAIGYAIGCAIGGGCRGTAPASVPVPSNMHCTPTQFGNNAPSYNCRPQ